MQIHDLNFELYITADILQGHIKRIADQINLDYANAPRRPLIIITLGGALVFGADLIRQLNFVTDIAYVKCSSYNNSMESSGCIDFELGLTISAADRDVIIIEDIVDTGNTYVALHDYLLKVGVRSVKIATMLLKSSVYKKNLPIDYLAVAIDDIFVIGFGLDYNQLGRNLNGIYRLTK